MILVDTSVWAQHIRSEVALLSTLLARRQVLTHPFVIGEIALGNLRDRDNRLRSFRALRQAISAEDQEVFRLIEQQHLYGRGIGYVDAHLLAAARLTPDTLLWSFDKRLETTAVLLGVHYDPRQ